MAGSLIETSGQFNNLNGIPESGARLYIYEAGTQTPADAFKDYALTAGQEHPHPIVAGSRGRFPMYWLADGSYSFRVTDSSGVAIIEYSTTTALGPSTGGGGGGSAISSEVIFQTGDVLWLDVSGVRAGWVRDNGRTIGSATSGAAERASADVEALFAYLWTNFADAVCAVSGGRGATAAADWAANKTITMPDKRGFSPIGLPDMGNSNNGSLASVPVIAGAVTTAGSTIGAATHTLSEAQLPALTKTTSSNGAHTHTQLGTLRLDLSGGGSSQAVLNFASGSANVFTSSDGAHTHTVSFGSGSAHNNTPRAVLGTFYRKL